MNLETTSTASIKKSSSMLITSSSIASRTSTISSMTTILATSTSTTSSSTSSAYSPQSSHSSTVSIGTTAVASTYSMTSIESSTVSKILASSTISSSLRHTITSSEFTQKVSTFSTTSILTSSTPNILSITSLHTLPSSLSSSTLLTTVSNSTSIPLPTSSSSPISPTIQVVSSSTSTSLSALTSLFTSFILSSTKVLDSTSMPTCASSSLIISPTEVSTSSLTLLTPLSSSSSSISTTIVNYTSVSLSSLSSSITSSSATLSSSLTSLNSSSTLILNSTSMPLLTSSNSSILIPTVVSTITPLASMSSLSPSLTTTIISMPFSSSSNSIPSSTVVLKSTSTLLTSLSSSLHLYSSTPVASMSSLSPSLTTTIISMPFSSSSNSIPSSTVVLKSTSTLLTSLSSSLHLYSSTPLASMSSLSPSLTTTVSNYTSTPISSLSSSFMSSVHSTSTLLTSLSSSIHPTSTLLTSLSSSSHSTSTFLTSLSSSSHPTSTLLTSLSSSSHPTSTLLTSLSSSSHSTSTLLTSLSSSSHSTSTFLTSLSSSSHSSLTPLRSMSSSSTSSTLSTASSKTTSSKTTSISITRIGNTIVAPTTISKPNTIKTSTSSISTVQSLTKSAVTSTKPSTLSTSTDFSSSFFQSSSNIASAPPISGDVSILYFIIVGTLVPLLLVMIVVIVIIIIALVIMKRRVKKNLYIVNESPTTSAEEMQTETIQAFSPTEVVSLPPIDIGEPIVMNDSLPKPKKTKRVTIQADTPLVPTHPFIEEFPNNLTAEVGQEVHFKVKFKGTPTPSFNWYHNGEPVTDDYAHEIKGDGSLLLVSVEKIHKGVYGFVANNDAGTVSQQVVLTVTEEEARVPSGAASNIEINANLIPVGKFGEFVADGHANNDEEFMKQYALFHNDLDKHEMTISVSQKNKPLNRFRNVLVYDDNRIILKPLPSHEGCQNDYINASFIDGYSSAYRYIATQGPMANTLVDFWRLIWQEKPHVIVMVTNLMEGGRNKCHQYWPDSDSVYYGPFKVTLIDKQVLPDYTVRELQLILLGSDQPPLMITQYHFTSWPDHGVPEYATSILQFHRRIKNEYKPTKGPMLVHCSAGVGRTGTFMAIDMGLQQAEKEGGIDIISIINRMRQQRMFMVQTRVRCGNTQIDSWQARSMIGKLSEQDPETGQTGYNKQFTVLEQVTQKPDEVTHNIASQNKDKNRSTQFLPPDNHRVVLKGQQPNYINAVYVDSYKERKAFIIAESPMFSTVRNFWKMIEDINVTAIVMLCQEKENDEEVCYKYWPTEATEVIFGEYSIKLLNEELYDLYTERTIEIKNKMKGGSRHKVVQYQITGWEPNGEVTCHQAILMILEEMNKTQRRSGNTSIVVHCSDTVGRSAMFCAAATTINKCKTEGVIDVFQVLKSQRIQKPGSVQTVEQYKGIFEIVQIYLDSFMLYSNFSS
ncbi:PREDICTED: uncharacterized threonine-rich GPI-anchored glycoprotein PJ4664.02-like [Amphimedon queenslandica]|uniref:protein-tyrosine-phosphatase n=2 Tax=Amphimedon queenslandica TaxID=400682 RepID=A0AAN0JFH4_AMPQE|nr:PREDICTED: uncharacterized threonine-rich GPI-anchored glycoprotein PJ4664.02-like [Amphimedon queenslandica]|eukprot:XP_019855551.1 PREDICTED: uncharacterized threonine-rich GPI-anchored glycoprotein PJ4664.02-like [Amphimedon queenslandica]